MKMMNLMMGSVLLASLLPATAAWQATSGGRPLPRAAPGPAKALTLRGGAVDLSLASLGAAYASSLASRPVVTKAFTAGVIFSLSDVAGQAIAPSGAAHDVPRTLTSGLVGLLYFGPALHWWLEMISRVVPGFDLKSTLVKTLMGQSCFGPLMTAVFFAASLVQVHGPIGGLRRWPAKVKQDLVSTWAAGLCFWPFVDLICYSFVPVMWIPLGYNVASFLWTIWLSLQAARQVS
ncbi:hypothetical protein AB1Y20_000738 [Prymnesium parvum]|uniref:Peroxisomal membrane protein MPV17 n=1 Tax=Prymnesium parvum TaxID=97485 RepID=A0AB34K660_PRYPA